MMRGMRVPLPLLACFILLLAGCAPPVVPPDATLWGGLDPGPYRAGWGLKGEPDPTGRDVTGDQKQPPVLPVGVWYPARDSRAPHMRLGDYFDLRPEKRDFDARAEKLGAVLPPPANPS